MAGRCCFRRRRVSFSAAFFDVVKNYYAPYGLRSAPWWYSLYLQRYVKEYDVPLDPDVGLTPNFVQNDGSDWYLGTPSVMIPGWGVHDAWLDFQGDLWFT